jgi:ribulose-5-phosphate 4-epimerase/fuculose-1-phosphate aldolase
MTINVGEGYVGTKFRTVYVRREPPRAPGLDVLIRWCRRFADMGLIGPAMGNLSIRTATGLVVTPTNTDPRTITADQFVEVLGVDQERQEVRIIGQREPSSESMLHAAIYAARPEINAIFHGHHNQLLAEAESRGIPVTAREQPYGTPALVNEVLLVARGEDFFIMRGHGFVALGRDGEQAGQLIAQVLGAP